MAAQRTVVSPSDTAAVAVAMTDAARQGLTVLPRGAGLGWHEPAADVTIETRQMSEVLEHAAGDLVARVQAGATMGHVTDVLARAGQRLALDVPPAVTVGGMIATGLAGPLRFRYGSPRDLLLGITLVRPDGVVARSGGKVVKNVAGYDLGKLFAGSHGTLGVITEATFRLHPVPQAVSYLTGVPVGSDRDAALQVSAVVQAAAGSQWQPSAIEIGPDLAVSILLEGTPDGVAERARGIRRIPFPGGQTRFEVTPEPPAWWGRLPGGEGAAPCVLRVTFWLNKLPDVLSFIAEAGPGFAVGGPAGAGLLYLTGRRDEEFVTGLRQVLAGRGSVRTLTDPPSFGEPLMRAVRDQFDPGHRMKGAG